MLKCRQRSLHSVVSVGLDTLYGKAAAAAGKNGGME